MWKDFFEIGRKRKRKKVLYTGFLEEKKIEVAAAENERKSENKKESKKEEKVKKERPDKKVNLIDLDITILVAVSSLRNKIGSSHIVKSLAYYIDTELQQPVCIVDYGDNVITTEINGIPVFKKERLHELYDKYKYIIIDAGILNKADRTVISQSQIKIMCSVLDDEYIKVLSSFVNNEDNAEKWKYIFNHVPEKKSRKVDDLMEDYEYFCMPVNDGKNFEKEMNEVFKKIALGKKL